jgi:heat-inducible transcriptional repressor
MELIFYKIYCFLRITLELSDREKVILKYIIEDFIQTANPVGSRYISKKTDVNLSPASIRNVMSDLENKDYLTHKHTSAGRIPTDKGYRYFVDELMENSKLSGFDEQEKTALLKGIGEADLSSEEIYKEVSRILGKLTQEISIVSQPYFSEGIFEKLELIELSSTKLLVVVSIGSGLVRTLVFDIESGIGREKLEHISRILNEKLNGLTLKEIRNTFHERISEISTEHRAVIKLFVDTIDKIFQEEKEGLTLYIGGTVEILAQPEFGNTKDYKDIIELTEDRDVVFHVLNELSTEEGIAISIGEENKEGKLKNCSIISSTYSTGNTKGKIAVVGPKRMNYAKLVSMLNYTSALISGKI